MNITIPKQVSPWFLLSAPPILFLLIIVAFSIYYSAQVQGDPIAIAEQTAAATPWMLVVLQLILLGAQFVVFRRQGLTLRQIGWQAGVGQTAWTELLLGAVFGALLGVLYIYVLSPLMTTVQSTVGDYVPAGELLPPLGASLVPFLVANVILAPFVEENIYRGFALTSLMPRIGSARAILISCLFFGLLHWPGGLWYMLLTGLVAGGLFAALFVRRGNLLAPFGAHLALNLVEFLLIWSM
jgi:membrane protease YdiL (CAAX protease family)